MKIKQLLILLVFACGLMPPAAGQTTYGEPDCGQWVSKKREPDKAWLLGYLSGASAWQTAYPKADLLKHVGSAEQIFLWMDNYCKATPLSFLSDGATKLMVELIVKAAR